jgi:hypothetical protein
MSAEHPINVVRVGTIQKHPNADTLSITEVEGNPVIIRTLDFSEGDLAVYVPIESLIPEAPSWVKEHASHLTFKAGWHRVRAVRLRGVFSMGILLPIAVLGPGPTPGHGPEGTNIALKLGIEHFEEVEDFVPEPKGPASFWKRLVQFFCYKLGIHRKPKARLMPVYSVEHYRKVGSKAFKDGEEVVVTEKIHGQCFSASYLKNKLVVSSHKVVRSTEDNSNWWRMARELDLANKLKQYPNLAFYGEIYGPGVQDLAYGVRQGQLNCKFFDIYDTKAKEYLGYDDALNILQILELEPVPLLYRGPHSKEKMFELAQGTSTLANHIREGVVIRRPNGHRCVLKLLSEAYLLRKGGTEKH